SAQNLDLGNWGTQTNPDISSPGVNQLGQPLSGTTMLPHLTIHGTGSGASDFYSFTVTASKAAPANAGFDMDHGFVPGQTVPWASKLNLYNSQGDLIAQGPGYSDPNNSALGGSGNDGSWFNDYLTYQFTTGGTYYLEVTGWLFTTGVPDGATYDLQVSL